MRATRRSLLSLTVLFLLFSCASVPEPAEDPLPDEELAPPEVIEPSEPALPGPEPERDSEPAEPAPEDPGTGGPAPSHEPDQPPLDEPLTLRVVAPRYPFDVTAPTFVVSAVASDGFLAALEVEILAGLIARDPHREPGAVQDFASLPVSARTYSLSWGREPVAVAVPAGFVDGAKYTIRLRGVLSDERVTEWVTVEPVLQLGIEPPQIAPVPATISTTPVLEIVSERRAYVQVGTAGSFVADGARAARIPFELTPGRHPVRARSVSEEGYLSDYGDAGYVTILDDARPAPIWPVGGETTLTPRPGLQWARVEGSAEYQARYRAAGEDTWRHQRPTVETSTAIADRLEPGGGYEWQVRVRNEAGTWFSWSETEQFVVGTFDLAFAPVVRHGETAVFNRGADGNGRDERPVREISLTVPYEMAVSPLTNGDLATILEYAVERGLAVVDPEGVWSPDAKRVKLVGLEGMDYGEQLGLRYAGERIAVAPGYEHHPAVGVTWHGAVRIVNYLSFLEGHRPAYDDDGSLLDLRAPGYRLPTEAEWEYAARGRSGRLFPWGDRLTARVANYYRSFDPFEDVNEPFTANGGPTNPVGFFNGTVRDGFQTDDDASPFGIRDLVGNVWEWCYDRYDPGYYAVSPAVDPTGPVTTGAGVGNDPIVLANGIDPNQRVVRGTAWNTRQPDVRVTNRGRYSEQGRSFSIGVRLVRSPSR